MRSIDAVRAHLVESLNAAVRRPGMFGEAFIRDRLALLAFIDGTEEALRRSLEDLRTRHVFASAGVFSTAQRWLIASLGRDAPGSHVSAAADGIMGGTYAELAARHGYLQSKRLLDKPAWDSLKAAIGNRELPRAYSACIDRFGVPSTHLAKVNLRWPQCMTFITTDPAERGALLLFWNELDRSRQPGARFAEPLLWTVRWLHGEFEAAAVPFGDPRSSEFDAGGT